MTARRGHRTSYSAGVLLFTLILSECATPPSGSLRSLNQFFLRSRDGVFLYQIPDGWFDASPEEESDGHAVWLVRGNLNATLAVEEIRLDDDVRQRVNDGALVEVGKLLSGLRAGKKGLLETRAPDQKILGGREVCTFVLENPATHEMHRALLFEIGDRLYTATLIVAGPIWNQAAGDSSVAAVQDRFVEGLRR